MGARRNNLGDALGDRSEGKEFGSGDCIKWGIVGFAEDEQDADVVEQGDGTTGPGGVSLVHVTLFEGRDITRRPKAGQADGRRVRCHIGWPLTVVPPLDTRVQVSFPDGDLVTSGNGAIFFAAAPAATQQFSADVWVLQLPPGKSLLIGQPGGNQILVTPTGVNLGAQSPSDAPALASKVDANFTAIMNYLLLIFGPSGGPSGIVCAAPTDPAVIAGTAHTPSMEATGSGTVKTTT
jgi:hypothetical protein